MAANSGVNSAFDTALDTASALLQQDPASRMLGIEIVAAKAGFCQLSMTVRSDMTNGYDVCHGGFIFTLADTAVAFACANQDKVAVSASSQIDFLASAKLADRLMATATIKQQSGRHCYCDIEVANQNGEIVALLRGRQVLLTPKAE
ncbi:MAG: acyl-CoA thioesterase [Phenylobacterium sp.]|jgi:acyl-CoA thioesterase